VGSSRGAVLVTQFFSNTGKGAGMRVRINWRRGPRQLRIALDRARDEFLTTVESEARSAAPSGVKNTIKRTAAQVRVDHPAAAYIEFGQEEGSMPPLGPIAAWAVSVGKSAREAFPIARAIRDRGRPARPFFVPAIEKALNEVEREFVQIWEGGRK